MPPLTFPNQQIETLILPPRRARIIADTDVLVVGGGPAGLGAAIGAAEAGASVVLAERYGFLGGNATAALVMPIMSYHTQGEPVAHDVRPVDLFPRDHGYGIPAISGVLGKMVNRLVERGGAISPSLQTGYVVPFDPEVFKLVALELLDETGVKFLLHSLASEVVGNKSVSGVVFETKSGPLVINAKTTVDCTGDGDIAAMAGANYEIGRDEDGIPNPMTLMFRITEFQRQYFLNYVKEHPDQWYGVHGLWDLVKKARDNGELDLHREDILFFGTTHEKEVSVNSTRVIRVKGTDVWDLTYAEWEGRRQMRQIFTFLRKYVPGFENAYIVQSGVDVGVRASRRIMGIYKLTADDVLGARNFDDVIARGSYPIDIHNPEGRGTIIRRLPPGKAYDIPLRSLVPESVNNLIIAGKCISGTYEAQSSFRAMPICMATGQAAGVCAAIAACEGKSPGDVPADEVQKELLRQGANLGDAGKANRSWQA